MQVTIDLTIWLYQVLKIGAVLAIVFYVFLHNGQSIEELVALSVALGSIFYVVDQIWLKETFDGAIAPTPMKPVPAAPPANPVVGGAPTVSPVGKSGSAIQPKTVRRNADYGISFLPPEEWSVPQERPPVCVTEQKCEVCPVYVSHRDNLPYSVIAAGLPETVTEVIHG